MKLNKRIIIPVVFAMVAVVVISVYGNLKKEETDTEQTIIYGNYEAAYENGYFYCLPEMRGDIYLNLLRYYDNGSGEEVVVCNKPNCKHEDESCQACYGSVLENTFDLCVYRDKLYVSYTGEEVDISGFSKNILYVQNLDGTEREKVLDLGYGCIQNMAFYDGKLYYIWGYTDPNVVKQCEDNKNLSEEEINQLLYSAEKSQFCIYNLETKKKEIVYEWGGFFSSMNILSSDDQDKLYIKTDMMSEEQYDSGDMNVQIEIFTYDFSTEEFKKQDYKALYGEMFSFGSVLVKVADGIYILSKNEEEDNVLSEYNIREDTLKEKMICYDNVSIYGYDGGCFIKKYSTEQEQSINRNWLVYYFEEQCLYTVEDKWGTYIEAAAGKKHKYTSGDDSLRIDYNVPEKGEETEGKGKVTEDEIMTAWIADKKEETEAEKMRLVTLEKDCQLFGKNCHLRTLKICSNQMALTYDVQEDTLSEEEFSILLRKSYRVFLLFEDGSSIKLKDIKSGLESSRCERLENAEELTIKEWITLSDAIDQSQVTGIEIDGTEILFDKE